MLIKSLTHGVGDRKRWRVSYCRWLDNTAKLNSTTVTSSSLTCTIDGTPQILGSEVVFFLKGGAVNETLTVTVQIVDSLGNTKNDTISFTVVAA